MPKVKVVIDTNIWISFLISKKANRIRHLIDEKRITVLFSEELLREFSDVTKRPKFSKHFSQDNIKKLFEVFDEFGKLIKTKPLVDKCRDKKDNFLLDLAIAGKANYLITGDNDLLVLKTIENTQIITLAEFINLMNPD